MEDSGIDSDSKSNSNEAGSTPSKLNIQDGRNAASIQDIDIVPDRDSAAEGLLPKSPESTEANGQLQKKVLNASQLQKRLERQISDAKRIRQLQSKADIAESQRRALIPRNRLSVPGKVALTSVVTKADEQPLVTWESDSDDEFDFHPMTKVATREITQQLKKDGYNLDLTPDDEDLDLIPPKPLNERCMCCRPGCSIL